MEYSTRERMNAGIKKDRLRGDVSTAFITAHLSCYVGSVRKQKMKFDKSRKQLLLLMVIRPVRHRWCQASHCRL